jgi:hypothetical protein
MTEERFRVSSQLFRNILARMDELSRAELMEIRAERNEIAPERCSPAFYQVVLALEDIASAELINRDLMGSGIEPK